jgi:serine protease Do
MPGDVIIEFDNKEIKFSSDLPHVVGQIQPQNQSNWLKSLGMEKKLN